MLTNKEFLKPMKEVFNKEPRSIYIDGEVEEQIKINDNFENEKSISLD